MKWSTLQMEEFKRLGIFALWDESYRTIQPDYESTIAHALGEFVERGMLYRGHKPVYWCSDCVTALAEAEVEYYDHKSPSVYVMYPVIDKGAMCEKFGIDEAGPLNMMIWTTTPWTLPANLAIALHPEFDYAAVEDANGEILVNLSDLKDGPRGPVGKLEFDNTGIGVDCFVKQIGFCG